MEIGCILKFLLRVESETITVDTRTLPGRTLSTSVQFSSVQLVQRARGLEIQLLMSVSCET